ncbi:DUF4424 domain-containing protein [Shinella curvata]|uniref:DUF4424 domain-containing protein n=1 Tax=Shinella curvata TaxID=1817964 RepID=A0ABT8X9Q7_9HYPH|nr:DUF4424 family protein [Shinella curvata]MCJ8055139.1 DUF4424 domain-containing protein [Shinella curvata]MDO6120465.1 DUF4424 domain-containing protein [Shinella curvata]
MPSLSSRLRAGAFSGVLLLAAGPSFANDSMVRIDAGGIELITSDSVRMVSEDLHVTRGEIRVDYVFANETSKAVSATIGFPLPAIDRDLQNNFDEQAYDLDNPMDDFVTLIDGKKIPSNRRMIVRTEAGDDISALLERTGLMPPPSYKEPWNYRPANDKQWAALEKAAAKAGIGSVRGEWRYQLVYIWDLELPAGASASVKHRYHPWIGGYGLYNTGDTSELRDRRRQIVDNYCLSDDAVSTMIQNVGPDGLVGYISEVGYILKTGANWAGPIGHFRLTIDPPQDGAAMMTCWPDASQGLVRTPIVFEAKDFTPTRDLLIGFHWKPEANPFLDKNVSPAP